jgi:hypothetical protein
MGILRLNTKEALGESTISSLSYVPTLSDAVLAVLRCQMWSIVPVGCLKGRKVLTGLGPLVKPSNHPCTYSTPRVRRTCAFSANASMLA